LIAREIGADDGGEMENARTYAIMAKPVGARCNLNCEYCYYLDTL
jgi:sulfatase maturation enzyme AslB (radical SAM superfamily)